MRILIGAPVLRREWIIDRWLEHASASAEFAGVDYSFVLLGGMNDPTFEVVEGLPQHNVARVYVDEPRQVDLREWPHERFQRMVNLRNMLLRHVRIESPDLFLSLDSDVLLHPQALANLVETQTERGWDAVGGYCYLSQIRACPSYSALPAPHVLQRPDIVGEVQRCDVLMAIVAMTPAAYGVDYEFNTHGEDIGHAVALKRAGLKVGVDARIVNRHVMWPADLNLDDPRCS